MLTVIAIVALALAALPLGMALWNRLQLRPPPRADGRPRVSVLIPARDEAGNIGACLDAVLAATDCDLEVVVLDDASSDATPRIVAARAAVDARVRLIGGTPLPDGWRGKMWACDQLGRAARHEVLLFIDADVRLAASAPARLAQAVRAQAPLISGFPRQLTGTLLERLLIPFMHLLMLGYLPLAWARRSTKPSFGAGCGQLFAADAAAWRAMGGHAAIRHTAHDGILLPRAFRRAGLATDLVDLDGLATCRMYHGAAQTWRGLAKNAHEGMGAPAAIAPWTLLLIGGHVAPFVVLAAALLVADRQAAAIAAVAVLCAWSVRVLCAVWFRASARGALLHPLGAFILTVVQWWGLLRHLRGVHEQWKGRPAG